MSKKIYNYIVRSWGFDNVEAIRMYDLDFKRFIKYGDKRDYLYPDLSYFLNIRNKTNITVELNKITGHFIYHHGSQTLMWVEATTWLEAIFKFALELDTLGNKDVYIRIYRNRFKPYTIEGEEV